MHSSRREEEELEDPIRAMALVTEGNNRFQN